MTGPSVMVFIIILMPLMLMAWNKQRIKGKMLCYFVRKDKSLVGRLCELKNDFLIWGNRAYDVYPDFVRVARYPSGWPSFLQELVPCSLYDEEDAIPLDWVNLDKRLERSMELRAALDENWLSKLVHESTVGGGFKLDMRKMLPFLLIAVGIIGFIFIFMARG